MNKATIKYAAIFILLIGCYSIDSCYGQNNSLNQFSLVQNLKQQAAKMGSAFVIRDYKAFANYTYPLILKSMGGASRMASILNKTTNDMKTQGMTFSNITFDEPSKIVKSGKELQATIAQHTEIKLSQGRLVSTSTLIAISIDKGIDWTFIDTSNKDMATLRKALPNLSSSIVIPPQPPPIRYNL